MIRRGLAAAVMVALLTACGADASDVPGAVAETVADTVAPTVAPTGTTVYVIALDNNFRAEATTAKVGDTVEFTNKGRNDHNVLPKDGRAWGVDVADFRPGDVYSHVFTEPGVYEYYCSIHGTNEKGMVGTITVTA